MRVAIVGAGAVGCYLAAKLATSGADVVLLARGAALETVRSRGIEVQGREQIVARLRTAASAEEAGPVDLAVGCVKAYSIPGIAPMVARLITPAGAWLCAANGLPWWYGENLSGPLAGLSLRSVDSRSERLEKTVRLFRSAGLAAEATADIRGAVWSKLYGNVSLNPLSAITGLTVDCILAEPTLRSFLVNVVEEVRHLAAEVGCPPEVTAEARVAQMATLGAFRTSMLQDSAAGRSLEHDAIIAAVVELGQRVGVAMPETGLLCALVRSFAETRGLLPG